MAAMDSSSLDDVTLGGAPDPFSGGVVSSMDHLPVASMAPFSRPSSSSSSSPTITMAPLPRKVRGSVFKPPPPSRLTAGHPAAGASAAASKAAGDALASSSSSSSGGPSDGENSFSACRYSVGWFDVALRGLAMLQTFMSAQQTTWPQAEALLELLQDDRQRLEELRRDYARHFASDDCFDSVHAIIAEISDPARRCPHPAARPASSTTTPASSSLQRTSSTHFRPLPSSYPFSVSLLAGHLPSPLPQYHATPHQTATAFQYQRASLHSNPSQQEINQHQQLLFPPIPSSGSQDSQSDTDDDSAPPPLDRSSRPRAAIVHAVGEASTGVRAKVRPSSAAVYSSLSHAQTQIFGRDQQHTQPTIPQQHHQFQQMQHHRQQLQHHQRQLQLHQNLLHQLQQPPGVPDSHDAGSSSDEEHSHCGSSGKRSSSKSAREAFFSSVDAPPKHPAGPQDRRSKRSRHH
ncbi:MAG: hypothetical protein Q8P67_05795 [archaeon]|nr:hypothetical protein [archaeon]